MNRNQAIEFLGGLHPSRVAIFVGAGMTMDLGYPSWPGLLNRAADFAARYSKPHSEIIRQRLASGKITIAADPLYDEEIPANERVKFLKSIFDEQPELTRRHKLLGSLPVLAFFTTNFDTTIERAIAATGRTPISYQGSDRFTRFNSELPIYKETYTKRCQERAHVLKIHNDMSDAEQIVLSSSSFKKVREIVGFESFYRTALSGIHLVFLGFGGTDPNISDLALQEVTNFAGYGIADSFLFAPDGTTPNNLGNIKTAHYDPKDNHSFIEELLKTLGDRWKQPQTVSSERMPLSPLTTAQAESSRLTADEARTANLTIFDLLVPVVSKNHDTRFLDLVGTKMVRAAEEASGPHRRNPQTVANNLSQKFHIAPQRAAELVRKYADAYAKPGLAIENRSPGRDPLIELCRGVVKRVRAFDHKTRLSDDTVRPVVRDVIEFSLQAFGCAAALSIVRGDRPSRADISRTAREVLDGGRWSSIGDVEKTHLSVAIPDLFLQPNKAEADILHRLSTTATSFGLIQALPSLESAEEILPKKLYLDTTIVLPLLLGVTPRHEPYSTLLEYAREFRINVSFMHSFVNEVDHHFERAQRTLSDGKYSSLGELRKSMGRALEDYENVFLVALVQSEYSDRDNPKKRILDLVESRRKPNFKQLIETRLSIAVETGTIQDDVSVLKLKQTILSGKRNWYGHGAQAREVLALHEARQLTQLDTDLRQGLYCWFLTSDIQLRRLVREKSLIGAESVLPVIAGLTIFEGLSRSRALSPAFTRLLWTANHVEQYDQVMAERLTELMQEMHSIKPLPLEEARRRFASVFVDRARTKGESEERDTDVAEITGIKPRAVRIRESAYSIFGELLEGKK